MPFYHYDFFIHLLSHNRVHTYIIHLDNCFVFQLFTRTNPSHAQLSCRKCVLETCYCLKGWYSHIQDAKK